MPYYGNMGNGGESDGIPNYDSRGRQPQYEPRRGGYEPGPDNFRGSRNQGREGGNRQNRSVSPPRGDFRVLANCYSIEQFKQVDWFNYYVEIVPAAWKRNHDENGELLSKELQVRGRDFFLHLKHEDSTPFSRAILNKLQQILKREEKKHMVHDGSRRIIAPHLLFEMEDVPNPEGYYGPADDSSNRPQMATQAPSKIFDIWIKPGCEDDEEGTETVHRKYFKVKLVYAGPVNQTEKEQISQVVNIALKNAMITSNMVYAFGKNPRIYYFKTDEQRMAENRLQRFLRDQAGNLGVNGSHLQPLLGILHSCQVSNEDTLYLVANYVVGLVTKGKPKFQENDTHQTSPLVQPENPTVSRGPGYIAGVKIQSLQNVIPHNLHPEIEQSIKKLRFNISYQRGPKWVEITRERLKTKGRTAAEIDGHIRKYRKTFRHKDIRVFTPRDNNDDQKWGSIVWDPSEYTFVAKNGKTYNAVTYYDEIYDIQLKYPHLPLIRVSKNEFFPAEFLDIAVSLEFKSSPEVEEAKKQLILKMHDVFQGRKKVEAVTSLQSLNFIERRRGEILEPFGLTVRSQAKSIKARILPGPKMLSFRDRNMDINRGSWNLRKVLFKKPGILHSFAIIDLTGRRPENALQISEELIQALKGHGVVLPYMDLELKSVLKRVSVLAGPPDRAVLPDQVKESFQEAQRLATDFFFNRILPHKALLKDEQDGTLCEAFLNKDGIIPIDESTVSHQIFSPDGLHSELVRVMYKGKNGSIVDASQVDSIDYNTIYVKYHDENGQKIGTPLQFEENVIGKAVNLYSLEKFKLECPSIVFILIPRKETELYNTIKYVSTVLLGLQSQVIVTDTIENLRGNHAPYFSNIALKVNAKLSSEICPSLSWCCIDDNGKVDGLPWIKECPTLVMGYSMSSATGKTQSAQMVVAATALLDKEGMKCTQEICLQKKCPLVAANVLRSITKYLAVQFYNHTGDQPKRILVYRAGGHDGMFQEIVSRELTAIRNAMYELRYNGMASPDCCKGKPTTERGCAKCCPPCTLMVAQLQHQFCIVPQDDRNGKNLPCGTCVDDLSLMLKRFDIFNTESSTELITSSDHRNTDFWLVSYTGMKGTSKGIYYRCLWNENACINVEGCTFLSKEKLQQVTYEQCYRYASATKSPKLVPVLQYAIKLANIGTGFSRYLIQENSTNEGKIFCLMEDEEDGIYISNWDEGYDCILRHFSSFGGVPFRHHISA